MRRAYRILRQRFTATDSPLPLCSIFVLSISYTLPVPVVSESSTSRKDEWMTDMSLFAEHQVRADLARLLLAAVETSGQPRCEIARKAQIHKDALRRVLAGERSASIAETLRILAASGVPPHAHLLLFLVGSDHAVRWLQSDLADFFEDFTGELPCALERVLGNQVHDVKPRWAKGTAHRVARLLSDHIDELERKDALLGDVFGAGMGGGHG
jgi:DNA-binding phage protein